MANKEYRDYDEESRKAIAGITPGKPSTYGGCFKDSSKSSQIFNEISNLQDIFKTRIVAVCGITDEMGQANPALDGWFFSDYFLFHHLLQGLGTSQHWCSAETPQHLLHKYQEYLHGNPHKPRKVVLSHKMIQDGKLDNITVFPRGQLKTGFMRIVKSECQAARANEEKLLILVFGHGDSTTYGITLGTGAVNKLKISNLRSTIGGDGLAVTFLATSCYSGGWSISPELNMTTIAAAGPNAESLSWAASASLGRMCGSIWASAVLPALLEESTSNSTEEADEILPENANEEQRKTFSSFCRSVFEYLFKKVDRKATEHDITFGAQDDEWGMVWTDRTGLPSADYRKRYDQLENYPISFQEHPELNRDPEMLRLLDGNESFAGAEMKLRAFCEHQAWSLELPRHGRGSTSEAKESSETKRPSMTRKRTLETAFGGSAEAFASAVAAIAKDYMESHPGPDNSGSNTGIHGAAKLCISGKTKEPRELLWLLHCLHYRSRLMDLADIYAAKISPSSKSPSCAEWDPSSVYSLYEKGTITTTQYNKLRGRLDRLQLFPSPNDQQGPSWIKPVDYLAVTLISSGLGGEAVEQKIEIICCCTYFYSNLGPVRSVTVFIF